MPFDLGAHWIHNPGRQSAAQAGAPRRARYLSGAARAVACASGRARRATRNWKTFSPRWCARAAPSPMPAGQGRYGGGARLAARSRRLAATHRVRARPLYLRQGACRGVGRRFRAPGRARRRRLLQAGLWRAARQARRRPAGATGDAGHAHHLGQRIGVDTPRAASLARTAIVTASTNALAADKIEFTPALAKRQLDAAARLTLGSYDHIALDLPGNPLGLQRDDLVFEKSSGPRTAALLANVSGSGLHLVEVAGDFGRELSAQGEARHDRLRARLDGLVFRLRASRARSSAAHATRWNARASCSAPLSARRRARPMRAAC